MLLCVCPTTGGVGGLLGFSFRQHPITPPMPTPTSPWTLGPATLAGGMGVRCCSGWKRGAGAHRAGGWCSN